MMTRKHYIALARSLKELRFDLSKASADGCDNSIALAYEAHVTRIVALCKEGNGNFDVVKFRNATL